MGGVKRALMKLLITGANGQVGHALTQRLQPLGELIVLDRQGADLSRPESLVAVLDAHQPDWIINAAAYTAVDKAESERDLAFTINANAPGVMAEWAAVHGAKLVHYSTDYVFDGELGGSYTEADVTAPLNVYGASKLAGEQAIFAAINSASALASTRAGAAAQAWVFRTTWVYAAQGNNFLKTMLRLGQEREALSVVNDQFGAPTSANWIAEVTAQLIQQHGAGQSPASGLYHLAAAGSTHWQGYAQYVLAHAARLGVALKVSPDDVAGIPASAYPTPAKRPMNSRLNSEPLMQALNLQAPDWREGVLAVVEELLGQGKSVL